jgi:hypothetical protein
MAGGGMLANSTLLHVVMREHTVSCAPQQPVEAKSLLGHAKHFWHLRSVVGVPGAASHSPSGHSLCGWQIVLLFEKRSQPAALQVPLPHVSHTVHWRSLYASHAVDS